MEEEQGVDIQELLVPMLEVLYLQELGVVVVKELF
jgi:hypothetical protein